MEAPAWVRGREESSDPAESYLENVGSAEICRLCMAAVDPKRISRQRVVS